MAICIDSASEINLSSFVFYVVQGHSSIWGCMISTLKESFHAEKQVL